jgi:hypothetical protein
MTRYEQVRTDPVLHYDTGHPTRLQTHARLGEMLAEHGEPYKITRHGAGWMLHWWPLYPGLDHETYCLSRDPWNDGRTVVRVLPSPGWKPRVETRTPDALPRGASPQSIERAKRYGL